MTTTFADIKKAAEGIVSTFVDDETPVGHFGVTTKVLGHTVTYLLEGMKDDSEAVVKGHVVIMDRGDHLEALGYSKGSLVGGYYLGRVQSYGDTFAKMV